MNNSKITFDNLSEELNTDRKSFLEKEKGRLSQIVEAINRVEASEDWQKLKSMLLDGVIETLKKQLASEASKSEVNTPEIYRLQGQLAWAYKYVDLKKLSEVYRHQIENIKNQI